MIVYLSAFSLLIKMWLTKRFKKVEDRRIPDVVYTSKNRPGDEPVPAHENKGKEGSDK